VSKANEVSDTPPPASHLDAAQALIDDIRAMKQRVPNFVIPESSNAGRQLAYAASVPQQFVDLTALAIRNNEELARGGNFGPPEMHDMASFADAYEPVADEYEAMALFVRHSVRVARNKAGSNALMTYAMAKRLAKRPETASLAPHVKDMRIALGVPGRKGKSKPAPKPATPDASSTPAQDTSMTESSPANLPKQ
jgi:hypothetical protein